MIRTLLGYHNIQKEDKKIKELQQNIKIVFLI